MPGHPPAPQGTALPAGTGPAQAELFGSEAAALPEGLRYQADFLDPQDEAHWIAFAQSLPLEAMAYKGYTARRRVASFGGRYDFDAQRLDDAPPLPAALLPLRDRAAAWLGVTPQGLAHALVAEYAPGTPLGWHRDVPDFEDVVGISLLGEAVMRFRRWPAHAPRARDVLHLPLAPRSIYLLRGPSRWDWQHSVAPTPALRYSITFRTRRLRR
ncbi:MULTISPECIES: alpha-ketoglutarate-dependent dioxygenase AlkB [Ramlibacter]|uniref:Alpha-ketoglutarate-dependent dioxygenase AlkB n=1 Tax=Ramlibacter aquaticus TaxID=2780094 RepID=A0ABR9SAW4_9BURK|nr:MULTISPECIES: alpha-ketoglutarate-dependent dioxygenase AlkB [Ramlibacter]MBE7939493.1 alpha-ketoglutarate-dependent dioxygenase AlkB [Ramlibacter aquaticus]